MNCIWFIDCFYGGRRTLQLTKQPESESESGAPRWWRDRIRAPWRDTVRISQRRRDSMFRFVGCRHRCQQWQLLCRFLRVLLPLQRKTKYSRSRWMSWCTFWRLTTESFERQLRRFLQSSERHTNSMVPLKRFRINYINLVDDAVNWKTKTATRVCVSIGEASAAREAHLC